MIERCENQNHIQYPDYGGRGIAVCESWRMSFVNFLRDMGERPDGTTLGRLRNNENYGPGNCAWLTDVEQARNKRNNRSLTHNGQTKLLVEWAEEKGIARLTLHERIFVYGWSVGRAIETPVGPESKRHRQLELDGRVQTLRAWANEYGINEETLASRLKKGADLREALTRPNRYKKRNRKPNAERRDRLPVRKATA